MSSRRGNLFQQSKILRSMTRFILVVAIIETADLFRERNTKEDVSVGFFCWVTDTQS